MTTTPGQIVYFGDSLTDNGNLLAYAEMLADPAAIEGLAGPTGSASDGPTYAAYASDLLGADSQNYAVASAEVDGVQDLAAVAENFGLTDALTVPADSPLLDIDINLNGQVGRFLDDNAGANLSDTTAVLFIGSNDYNEVDLTSETVIQDTLQKMDAIITGIAEEALRLWAAGVSTIQIATLPALDFYAVSAELSPEDQALANAVFEIHNRALTKVVELLQDAGVNAELFDVTQITDALTEDLTAFGFIAPAGTQINDPGTLDLWDADQVFSTDELHPSTAAHGVIGAFTAFVLAGGTTTALTDNFDFWRGGDGDDFASGLAGTDILRAGYGNDILLGGTGQDDLMGQQGNDLLSGGSDNDLLRGNLGHDILGGGEGDDILLGGGGNDLLVDGLGSDICRGGAGNDTFIFTEASLIGGTAGDTDLLYGGDGLDELILVLSADTYADLAGDLAGADPDAALASLGITASGIEQVTAIDGRDGLAAYADAPWYQDADLWGLI
ncbi:SGNH/GDSL hydrolase family protein [Marinibacterium sp. SX1]|uniref:SGNH/GDSL hydrolase family protein n=1 Tax=Marinibacterium sp. SX1 TaxID=3388424 RepID=UPI003D16366F